jgi:hypothetical protein
MPWQGGHPIGALVTTTYRTGVARTKPAMAQVEARLARLPALEKWFVDIACSPAVIRDASFFLIPSVIRDQQYHHAQACSAHPDDSIHPLTFSTLHVASAQRSSAGTKDAVPDTS